MRNVPILSLLTLMNIISAPAQERWQARSLVIHQGGIVATSQTLASQAGAQILARGGSAVDAAIAANAVLSVVEPMMCGPGGDLFAIYYDAKSGKLQGLNASGPAPRGLTREHLAKAGHASMPTTGIHTVTVPGAVAGWKAIHERYGKLPWKDLFTAATHYAEQGFGVTEIIQYDWEGTQAKLAADANAKRVFLPAPKAGDLFRNRALAAAFRLIAEQGPAAFYRGAIAEKLLATSRRLGGTLTIDDLQSFTPEWVDPISTTYRGWRVSEMPPNGQGVGVLTMLNLMERFDLPGWDPLGADAMHVKVEAQKLAYADLRAYVADPRRAQVPAAGLIDKSYAADRAGLIDMAKANCEVSAGRPPEKSGNTIYLAVVDREGNIASWIQSISDLWGSGVVVDDYGFHLHDRGGSFTLDARHPNALEPGKRPYHTIIPGFMSKGDEHVGFGIMRGMNQPLAHAQFVSYVVDHGMNIQAALEAPRFTKRTRDGCDIQIENRVPDGARGELSRRGHVLDVRGAYSGLMGGGQAVLFNSRTGMKFGASSPRKDGAAIPEPLR